MSPLPAIGSVGVCTGAICLGSGTVPARRCASALGARLIVLRRLFYLTATWVALFALLAGAAAAQDDSADGEEGSQAEPQRYGDAELIATLREYDLLDEWIAASPVSPEVSLLLVRGNGNHQAQRQRFLNSLEAWASRTEQVRDELARLNAAQSNADGLRSAVNQVRQALVLDDRLASGSDTLVQIADALDQLAALAIPDREPGEFDDSLTLAEAQLNDLRARAQAEVMTLNSSEAAVSSSGAGAFVGFEDLLAGLATVDQLLQRGRNGLRPALEDSERLASSALAQIPGLHSARMLGGSDVGGLSVVTVDAYVRAAARVSCSVDWALLAGIGQIESNHGRIGGASVSRSGQVSTTILGPLLDGGQTALREAVGGAGEMAAQIATGNSLHFLRLLVTQESRFADDADGTDGDSEALEEGNGFEVVVDTDNGRLDGNDQWDRAVGPMQFLPETWSRWATDGNGDGVSDPNNLYDATAAAARFLCNLSATRSPSPSSFLLGYNSSQPYVRQVLATAQRLRGTLLPDP